MQNQDSYKLAIKKRVKELSRRNSHPITLKKLSQHLEIQYTYLSRLLNSEDEHIKEDSLFEALEFLEFHPSERDYLMQCRILEGSNSPSRVEAAKKVIDKIEFELAKDIEEKGAHEQRVIAETDFMINPFAAIVLASLSIPQIKRDVRLLLKQLNLSQEDLKKTMNTLEAAGFIVRKEDWFKVEKITNSRMHFRPDHPLMRIHQQQIKLISNSFLQSIAEDRKKSVMVTFAADQSSFQDIKEEFQNFIKKVEGIAKTAKPKKTYQMTFDFFDWI